MCPRALAPKPKTLELDPGRCPRLQMQRVLEGVAEEVAPLVAAAGRPRRVACLEWNDPLMGCGHWCAAASDVARFRG